MLVLPWLVIDRGAVERCPAHTLAPRAAAPNAHPIPSPAADRQAIEERHVLAQSAQAALDGVMHFYGVAEMVPRKEWEPYWRRTQPEKVLWEGAGCLGGTPVVALLRYDLVALQRLARAVNAEYVWLGATVVALTPAPALRQDSQAELARSAALLVRVRDGKRMWEGEAARHEHDVPRQSYRIVPPPPWSTPGDPYSRWSGPLPERHDSYPPRTWNYALPPYATIVVTYSPPMRREIAVDQTARALGNSFGRAYRLGTIDLKQEGSDSP
jgi:hypothetical protein